MRVSVKRRNFVVLQTKLILYVIKAMYYIFCVLILQILKKLQKKSESTWFAALISCGWWYRK